MLMKMISKSIVLKLFLDVNINKKYYIFFIYINSSYKHLFIDINMELIIYLISN